MKKLTIFFSIAAAALAMVGCQEKEIETFQPGNEGSTFELIAEIAQTKTTLDGYTVEWDEDDVIYMVTSNKDTWSTAKPFLYSDGKFTPSESLVDGDYTLNAIYCTVGQSTYHKRTSTSHKLQPIQNQVGKTTIHIQDNDALVGTFDVSLPTSEPVTVNMAHLYTMMEVDVKNNTGADIQITKFEMTASGADLAGVFNVLSFGNEPSISTKQDVSPTITVNVTDGFVAKEASFPIYFVMAPIKEYTGEIKFRVTTADGDTYTKTLQVAEANKLTFAAGKYNKTPYTISTADVQEAKTLPFNASFEADLADFIPEGDLPEGLSYVWSHDGTYKCAKATAYVSGTRHELNNYYLVSPLLDLTEVEVAKMSFEHAGNYFNGTEKESAKVYVREEGGEWSALDIPTYFTDWTFVHSGDIDLTEYVGKKIEIGFNYSSTTSNAGTWEIKNLSVTAEAVASEIKNVVNPETISAEGAEVAVPYSIINPKDGQNISASTDVDWITSFDYSTEGVIKFVVAANESTDLRSAVVTLSYEGAESVDINVTQKGQSVAGAEELTVKINLAEQGYSNQQTVETVSVNPITVAFNKGTNSNVPKYYTSGTAVRVYGGGYFTVETSVGEIVGVKLVYGTSDGSNEITTNVGAFSNDTWSGSAASVTFIVGGTTGNRRIKEIHVTYLSDGTTPEPATLKSISVESPKVEYFVGDTFVEPTVMGTYSDGSVIKINGAQFSGYNMSAEGSYNVMVTYEDCTTEYTITVTMAGGNEGLNPVLAYTFDITSYTKTGYGVCSGIATNNDMTWTVTCGQGGYLGINKAANDSKIVLGDYAKVGAPLGYASDSKAVVAVISDKSMSNVNKIEIVAGSVTAVSGTVPSNVSLVYSIDGGSSYTLLETQTFDKSNGNTFTFEKVNNAFYALVYYSSAWFRLTGTQIKYYN